MRAAYSAGVLGALLEARIHTGWVGGISAGSSCTVNYLVRDAERARKCFVDIAAQPEFGNLSTWVRGKGMFHSEYIYERTSGPGEFLELDMDLLRANTAQVRIGGFECATGRTVYWGSEDLSTLHDLSVRVRASSTMPILMPWTTIDGTVYCDGALGSTGGFAHDAARADGFTKYIVITTRERGYVKPPMRNAALMKAALRQYPEVATALALRPKRYNESLEELTELEKKGDAFLIFPERMRIKNGERNLAALGGTYSQGLAEGRRLIPQLREWLGFSHDT